MYAILWKHRAGWHSGNSLRLLFRRCPVRIPAPVPPGQIYLVSVRVATEYPGYCMKVVSLGSAHIASSSVYQNYLLSYLLTFTCLFTYFTYLFTCFYLLTYFYLLTDLFTYLLVFTYLILLTCIFTFIYLHLLTDLFTYFYLLLFTCLLTYLLLLIFIYLLTHWLYSPVVTLFSILCLQPPFFEVS
jgi:hypothetical protein